MKGPIYGGFMKGVRTKDNVGFFTPAWKFRPSRVSSIGLSASIPFTVLIGSSLLGAPLDVSHFNPHVVGMIGAAPLFTIMHGVFMKPMSDLIKVINPLRDLTVSDNAFNYAVDSVGSLDEILSFVKWGKDIQHENTIPVVTDEHVHYFEAQDLRNPVQARDNPDYVPNDVNLNGSRLTLITGPNSGGKTTYCKSVAQNQILGQVGSRVLASSAKLNITDRIAYQAPMFDALQDDEGRFGTELKRTRDIFYATSPKSLVILDELSEGTTAEEKMEQSRVILDGFYTIGNNTMLVTHNHDLVDAYREKGRGQYLQAEFNGHTPTHRMKDGISRVSHANKVAEKIGFAKKDIETHLKDKGYI